MGHTNSTPNIGLPQFIGTDKPTFLGDVNGAMSAIDTKVGSIDAAIATTDAKADNAVADASGAVTTATNAVNTAGAASTTATQANNLATQALTVANNTANLCTQNIVPSVTANTTAIGTLADLTTTAKDNLVNAINEVAQGGGGGGLNLRSKSFTFTGETNAQGIASLKAGVDPTDISDFSYVKGWDGSIYHLSIATASIWRYSVADAVNATATNISTLDFANEKLYVASGTTTPTDNSSATHSTGTMTLYY